MVTVLELNNKIERVAPFGGTASLQVQGLFRETLQQAGSEQVCSFPTLIGSSTDALSCGGMSCLQMQG